MNLTRSEQRILRQYQAFHERPPNGGRMFVLLAKTHWWYVLLCVVVGLLAYVAVGLAASAMIAGFLLGVLRSNVATAYRLIQTWPTTEMITDWSRVTQLLENENAVG